jgi:cytochrome c
MNDLVKDPEFVLDSKSFLAIRLPNADGFFDDDREVTERAFWNREPCMRNCSPEVRITGRERALDVTPDSKSGPVVE